MGIHGIYQEIGPGKRIALSKLAVAKFEETGRPLRIAIDVSIWLFQIQASKGGTNPALRTFYYRLLRLIALSIHPIFVFDGPNKPPFKRNKRTGPSVASIPDFLAKQLLKQFGFPIHFAPGEAEAECALLQREGIVDAVLSEDVDTMMFGSGLTIRNWSPEHKSSKTPTHVNVYDSIQTKNGPSGLDREGMILVALMSGGDYVPEGIPGCGPKTACEAARAGFGSDLCKISKNDAGTMREWRQRLQHELKTNESKLFKRKHGTLVIPDDFPRPDILGYYTHPAISNQTGLESLRRSIKWDQDVDFPGLREFTKDAFGWARLSDAKHFIRSLAPSLLVRNLRMRGEAVDRFPSNDLNAIQEDEGLLVKAIHGMRQHRDTDSTTELRVSFTPIELVKIDLDAEDPDVDGEPSECGPDDDVDADVALEIDDGEDEDGPKKRGPTKFDPTKPARHWVLETYVKVGVPLKVQDYEAALRKPKRAATTKETSKTAPKPKGARRAKTTGDTTQRSIDSYAKVMKPGVKASRALAKTQSISSNPPAASLPSIQSKKMKTVIDLLSSSPPRPSSTAPQHTEEKPLSPTQEDIPSSVTKRKKRAPMQRSHTLPADKSTNLGRPGTPPPWDNIETLDLVGSPVLPSPSPLPVKKARTRTTRDPPTTHATRQTSTLSSSGQPRQTTLDTWSRPSPAGTPTKPRKTAPLAGTASIPVSPQLRPSRVDVESLDLTLSSPPRPLLAQCTQTQTLNPPNARRTRAAHSRERRPLHSISSNPSQPSASSSRSSTTTSAPKPNSKTGPITRTRRTSPRLHKTASLEIDTLDLTQLSFPPPSAVPAPAPDPLPTPPSLAFAPPARPRTLASSKPPDRAPLPQNPTSRTSPPAAWKSREKKKREIRIRESLAGSWAYVETSSSPSACAGEGKEGDGRAGVVLKGKERRRWRESEIEVLDMS